MGNGFSKDIHDNVSNTYKMLYIDFRWARKSDSMICEMAKEFVVYRNASNKRLLLKKNIL